MSPYSRSETATNSPRSSCWQSGRPFYTRYSSNGTVCHGCARVARSRSQRFYDKVRKTNDPVDSVTQGQRHHRNVHRIVDSRNGMGFEQNAPSGPSMLRNRVGMLHICYGSPNIANAPGNHTRRRNTGRSAQSPFRVTRIDLY